MTSFPKAPGGRTARYEFRPLLKIILLIGKYTKCPGLRQKKNNTLHPHCSILRQLQLQGTLQGTLQFQGTTFKTDFQDKCLKQYNFEPSILWLSGRKLWTLPPNNYDLCKLSQICVSSQKMQSKNHLQLEAGWN